MQKQQCVLKDPKGFLPQKCVLKTRRGYISGIYEGNDLHIGYVQEKEHAKPFFPCQLLHVKPLLQKHKIVTEIEVA